VARVKSITVYLYYRHSKSAPAEPEYRDKKSVNFTAEATILYKAFPVTSHPSPNRSGPHLNPVTTTLQPNKTGHTVITD
jgi:hypothetical protein